MSDRRKIAVLGAGSWGTALAILLAGNGHQVLLWGRNQAKIQDLKKHRSNHYFLPDVSFPESLQVTSDLSAAVLQSEELLIVVPSHAFRTTLQAVKSIAPDIKSIAWATKGFEHSSQKLLHQVTNEVFPGGPDMAVISGPTFALEVARSLPTAVTVASNNTVYAKHISQLLHNSSFRPYHSDDIIGLEVGGAVKNVLAIAAGIADGLGYGANTRAALITRGLVEMIRLSTALGGQKKTLMGLSGLGDLLLTCTDNQSRNRRMGLAIGKGLTVEEAAAEIKQVVEGVQGASEIHLLGQRKNVEMPICSQVYQVLYNNLAPQQAVQNLLSREFKTE